MRRADAASRRNLAVPRGFCRLQRDARTAPNPAAGLTLRRLRSGLRLKFLAVSNLKNSLKSGGSGRSIGHPAEVGEGHESIEGLTYELRVPLREAPRRWAELLRRICEMDPLTCPHPRGLTDLSNTTAAADGFPAGTLRGQIVVPI